VLLDVLEAAAACRGSWEQVPQQEAQAASALPEVQSLALLYLAGLHLLHTKWVNEWQHCNVGHGLTLATLPMLQCSAGTGAPCCTAEVYGCMRSLYLVPPGHLPCLLLLAHLCKPNIRQHPPECCGTLYWLAHSPAAQMMPAKSARVNILASV
jgi:hypothetical protein